MPPTIILIRHAQAQHNATENWFLPDPPLTELGHAQCQELSGHLQQLDHIAQHIELIVVSPLQRTLETAALSLGWLIDRGVPVVVRGEWQENSTLPCDTGSPISKVKHLIPQADHSQIYPEWPQKVGNYAFTQEAISQRGSSCREWLKNRPEKGIAVVTHSAFLRMGVTRDVYANADYRIYDFASEGNLLLQRAVTEERGGGLGKSSKEKSEPKPSDFELPNS